MMHLVTSEFKAAEADAEDPTPRRAEAAIGALRRQDSRPREDDPDLLGTFDSRQSLHSPTADPYMLHHCIVAATIVCISSAPFCLDQNVSPTERMSPPSTVVSPMTQQLKEELRF
ncbi:hypothetical protein GUJ93_ZPchr0013g33818 [Zizania palustris]|uniref:Uncharacterized protein n=1 Tax=Zizania palustris TaxID=103762 RepID=A0A8J5X673_ZIZPA|nr:hypothetical protein GUJ93_ZPchr0013g33818 [Zizania palustris]